MEPATRGTIRTIAGQLAVIVGVVHMGLGTYAAVSGAAVAAGDVRVVIWTVVGAVLVAGVAVGAVGWQRRRLYVLGVVVSGLLVAALLLWPLVAGRPFYLGSSPATSPAEPLGYVHAQLLQSGPVAAVALATELALVALLFVLLQYERPR